MSKKINIKTNKTRKVNIEITTENNYFSVTGESIGACGCMHTEILADSTGKQKTLLKKLIDLHLCNLAGEAMHVIANGVYFIKEKNIEALSEHLHLTKEKTIELLDQINKEYDAFIASTDTEKTPVSKENFITNFMKDYRNKNLQKWKKLANEGLKAIDTLEQLEIERKKEEKTQENNDFSMFNDPDKAKTFLEYLKEVHNETFTTEEIEENECLYSAGSFEYLILDADEAEQLARKELENYIEERVLPEIQKEYRKYFDRDKFIDDHISIDNLGEILNRYDGTEENFNNYNFYRQ